MVGRTAICKPWAAALGVIFLLAGVSLGAIRDGGIDPANLGKGDWIYFMSDATNHLGGNVATVTNENSLMLFYKNQGIRYIIVKAATSDILFNGSYNRPQFTSNLCNIAHGNGLLVFGYNRSYGSNILGEIAISDYVFRQGGDGFVWDAESEWESSSSWIGSAGPAKAWQLCSAVRSNWPTKFLAHAPFPIISYHTSFPYKEFGYWSDTVMPQIYHYGWVGVERSPSGGINWSDVNWFNWQNSLFGMPPTNINGLTVYWTNAIKPLAPINHVYGPEAPPAASPIPDKDVLEFIDYLAADPHAVTPGGYKGVSFWRADLHGTMQWSNIQSGTSGDFPGVVNNLVIDNPAASASGAWSSVRTFYDGSFYAGSSDTNSFGTNYLYKSQGSGTAYVQFTPGILAAGAYDVFQWHPRRADASASVPFVIRFDGGTATVNANQKTNSGNWSLLGRFSFAAGTNGNVRVTDAVPEAGAIAMADGVKFVFVPGSSPPVAPTNLIATAISTSRIDLAWVDKSSDESGFVITRSTNSDGPFTTLFTVPANSTNYSDTGLSPGRLYFYTVRAINLQGSSTNSNIASATTFSPPTPPAILSQPKNQSSFSGQPVTFVVETTGSTPQRYQWRFEGQDLANETNASMTLSSPQFSSAGYYSVFVTNAYGNILSSNAYLTITALGGFGDNSFGQRLIPASATNVIAIAAGGWHNLALRADGTVAAWGNNFDSQCDVPAGVGQILAVSAGGYHSLALDGNGFVHAWGANVYGQATVPAAASNVIAVAAGKWHSLALRADGAVIGWGDNSFGQTSVPLNLSGVIAIAAGGNHSLALRQDRTVIGWGENTDSQGIYAGQSLAPWYLTNVMAIAAGDYHSLALTVDGSIVAWGDNSQGQLLVPPALPLIATIAAGGAHNLALGLDGTVYAWGANGNGQSDLPQGLSNFCAVAAGEYYSLLLQTTVLPVARLYRPSWRDNHFTVLAQTLSRRSYSLEFKNPLNAGSWTALPASQGNGALKVLSDPAAFSAMRFYRMRQW